MSDPRRHATLGARPEATGTHFRVWAPGHESVELLVDSETGPAASVPLTALPDGYFGKTVAGVRAGDRYRYAVDGHGPYPDPASRFQPAGVHGPSEVVDPTAFAWSDAPWRGVPLESLVIYELHVGTFTPEGTFRGVIERLPYLRDLGVTAIELMPVADFPGTRNWGYDGVALFAPARCYGTPDDLRALVDAAHRTGLALLLDVVYNHVGPDGAYLFSFSPWYFTDRHPSPWGKSVNLDGPHSTHVRAFLIENALHWIGEYHIDGLRLDATHAMQDDGPRHFLAELAERVHAATPDRHAVVIAEDHRNLARMVMPMAGGGWGLDGVWSDDFHHQVRRALAGDSDGYYADYSASTRDIATTITQGWFYTGQLSTYLGAPRGTVPTGVPPQRFVVCLQNHDQIGNRALGGRLNHEIEPAALRSATVLLLTLPQTPLLFMGQEWAASTPFLYFTDHHTELGRLVTEGRRREFEGFAAFSEPAACALIPDPQALTTFEGSTLQWHEREEARHAGMLRLHQALLRLRREDPALRGADAGTFRAQALDDDTLVLIRWSESAMLAVVVRLRGAGRADLGSVAELAPRTGHGAWRIVLTSEASAFTDDPAPPEVELSGWSPLIHFRRAGAVILARTAPE